MKSTSLAMKIRLALGALSFLWVVEERLVRFSLIQDQIEDLILATVRISKLFTRAAMGITRAI
jgi:hypothetical protein